MRSPPLASADAKAVKLYTTTNLIPGFAVNTDAAGVKALASRSDVVKVSRIIPKTADQRQHRQPGARAEHLEVQRRHRQGRPDRRSSTPASTTPTPTSAAPAPRRRTTRRWPTTPTPDWRSQLPQLGKEKILGGYDFAGDDYNADPTSADYQPIPHPDKNPLDCNEHGTHVAGIAAGYGVNANGNDVHRQVLQARPDQRC